MLYHWYQITFLNLGSTSYYEEDEYFIVEKGTLNSFCVLTSTKCLKYRTKCWKDMECKIETLMNNIVSQNIGADGLNQTTTSFVKAWLKLC